MFYNSIRYGLARKIELNYTDENGKEARPIMLHRVVYGSIERFIGILQNT
jgi:threonyl-tRNA synthetase